MTSNYIKIITLLLLLSSCNGYKGQSNSNQEADNSNNSNHYANFFDINIDDQGNRVITVNETWSGQNVQSIYVLFKNNEKAFENKNHKYSNATFIQTPVRKIVCMSTSHLAFINELGQSSSIVAVSGGKYISDTLIRSKLKKGEILDVGFEASVNYEILMQLNPDVVFAYGISGENNQYIEKIKQAGIKVVVVSDYMENHPLGKLEYLKFFGAFFNQEEMADSLYNLITHRYIETKSRVENLTSKPNVLLNAPWKDAWYIPGQNNYMSHLIQDAGGEVLLSKQGESHSYTHSIENVIQLSYNAQYWLNPNFYSTLKELREGNPLFGDIPVVQNGKVFNNTKRDTPGGGSDFWERGVIEPDIILNDLINILHPDLGNKKELVYYKLLQ